MPERIFNRRTVERSIYLQIFALTIVVATVVILAEGHFMRIGPHDDLIVAGVPINTFPRYVAVIVLVAILRIAEVIANEFGQPELTFAIYDPKSEIRGIGRRRLQIYATTFYTVDNLKNAFMVVVSISQVDIAIFGVLISQFVGIFTIDSLIKAKMGGREDSLDSAERGLIVNEAPAGFASDDVAMG